MRSTKVIHTVSCHAEGEVGDVIIGGVTPPAGDSIWEQREWIAKDDILRNFMLNEPRGGVFRACSPRRQYGRRAQAQDPRRAQVGQNAAREVQAAHERGRGAGARGE